MTFIFKGICQACGRKCKRSFKLPPKSRYPVYVCRLCYEKYLKSTPGEQASIVAATRHSPATRQPY